ncbi:unnamed protein product, partial [Durusdinium trenchii]
NGSFVVLFVGLLLKVLNRNPGLEERCVTGRCESASHVLRRLCCRSFSRPTKINAFYTKSTQPGDSLRESSYSRKIWFPLGGAWREQERGLDREAGSAGSHGSSGTFENLVHGVAAKAFKVRAAAWQQLAEIAAQDLEPTMTIADLIQQEACASFIEIAG